MAVVETTGRGFSLWLVPTGDTHDELARRIGSLSRRFGTPVFEPHVTLLAGIAQPRRAVLDQAATFAQTLAPFEVRLREPGQRPEYFRCLFLRAEGDGLMAAHMEAARAFGRRGDPEFLPHLSLLYADLQPRKRQALVDEIGGSHPAAFGARAIHLYSTEGMPEAWFPVGTVGLTGPSS